MTCFLVAGDEGLCHVELHHKPSACVRPATGQLEQSWVAGPGLNGDSKSGHSVGRGGEGREGDLLGVVVVGDGSNIWAVKINR